jgi:hypothetical protein
MQQSSDAGTTREAVGIFFDTEHLKGAIEELAHSGFERSQLGLLAGEHTVRQALGDFYDQVNELSASSEAPCTAFVEKRKLTDHIHGGFGDLYCYGATVAGGAAVASAAVLGGAVLAAVTGALAVGAVGALMGLVIHETDADFLEDQIGEGRLLLFVSTPDAKNEARALEILTRHTAFRPKVYTVAACH